MTTSFPESEGPAVADQPRAEYPRPNLVREQSWINLNGSWQFELDLSRSGRSRNLQSSRQLQGEIQVPFAPESKLSGVGFLDFIPALWYRKDLSVPEHWQGRRTLLHVGACDYSATVFLDGKELATHCGGYTPFTVELTAGLAGRSEASLTIYAEDDVRSGSQAKGKQSHVYESVGWDYTRTTGIWQTVWLESVPNDYIRQVRITPQLQTGTVLVEVRCDGHLLPPEMRLRVTARADGQPTATVCVPCRSWSSSLQLSLDSVRPWSLEDPFLYDLEVRLEGCDGILDTVRSYFGMREISINGYALELNGKPVFQRLILDQGFYPHGIYTAATDEELRLDIELGQAMGFNGARLHQKVFEPRFLYWCDRLGYLVWGETPDWGLDVSRSAGLADFILNWIEQLERDYNHPSLVGWCPFNEHDNRPNPEAFRTLYRLTRAVDRTRPVIDTSGWMHVETDIYDVHDYTQNPAALEERYRPVSSGEGEIYRNLDIVAQNCEYKPGQPYFVSEFGGIWWNPGQVGKSAWGYGNFPATEEEFLTRFKGLVEVLLANPRMCAFCYTQLTDVEQEVNGLYTSDRKPKFDPDLIRAIVAQVAAIEQVRPVEVPVLDEDTSPSALR
jgi:beta-galactosidase/beta-glucuronidase